MPLFSFELCTKIAPSTLYSWPLYTANIYAHSNGLWNTWKNSLGDSKSIYVFTYKIPIVLEDRNQRP